MSLYCSNCTNCQISIDDCVDDWIDDGYCDDYNNKPACQWDGRDCCSITNPNIKKNLYCSNCTECERSGCVDEWIGDGYCDDNNNNVACNFDNGDCCSSGVIGWDKYCIDCDCLTPATTCEDKETEKKCNKWKKKGKCSNNWTANKCQQTCGKC